MAHVESFIDEDSRWKALVARDRAADGAFYYAVTTTGVFCRPGCASKVPSRRNVRFFDTYAQAERAGFRPCKRCKPDAISPRRRLVERVIRACCQIDAAETPPTLDHLAAQAGLSRWHFQRLFKEVVGVTPKQYAGAKRAHRFRERLAAGQTVTEAIFDAGFGSSSRAHDNSRRYLSMTPADYRAGGKGLTIRYGIAPCFLGWVIVAATGRGICAIAFDDEPTTLTARLQERFNNARLEDGGPDFAATLERVIAFIEAPKADLDLPLDIQGTAFQQRVWHALQSVPPGSTISYTELAHRIGSPASVRAVAGACAANQIAVAVPCHRAVRSDGTLSGYRWGVERKRALLNRERGNAIDSRTPGGNNERVAE